MVLEQPACDFTVGGIVRSSFSRIQPPRDVTRAIAAAPPLDLAMPVGELVVFRSHLGGGPARYEAVERFGLG